MQHFEELPRQEHSPARRSFEAATSLAVGGWRWRRRWRYIGLDLFNQLSLNGGLNVFDKAMGQTRLNGIKGQEVKRERHTQTPGQPPFAGGLLVLGVVDHGQSICQILGTEASKDWV